MFPVKFQLLSDICVFLDETGISCRVRVEPCFSVAMGYRPSHVTQEHLSEIQKIKSNFVWFCPILLKF